MAFAETAALRSRDPSSRVGAVIVIEPNVLVASGYNGLARGVTDAEERLLPREEKLRWVCHAEMNAIFNAARVGIALNGGTLYATRFPCATCANAIVQVGLGTVYTSASTFWKHDPSGDTGERSLTILREGGVRIIAPNFPHVASAGNGSARRGPARNGTLPAPSHAI